VDVAQRLEQIWRPHAGTEQHNIARSGKSGAGHDDAGRAGRAQGRRQALAFGEVIVDERGRVDREAFRVVEVDLLKTIDVDPRRPGAQADLTELLPSSQGVPAHELRQGPEG